MQDKKKKPMKKFLEYFAIPLAIKTYMIAGAVLYKVKQISQLKFSSHKPRLKPWA